MVPDRQLTVGIDPHKKSHTAVIIDGAGHQLGDPLVVGDGPEAVVELISWATCHSTGNGAGDAAVVRFAIEDGRGLARRLADALVAAGFPVVWVPVRLMVAARRLLPPRGKSDPIDALAAARAAIEPANQPFLCAHSIDEPGRELRLLVDRRRDLVATRTARINTLRWQLREYDPGLEPATLTTLSAPRQLAATLAGTLAGDTPGGQAPAAGAGVLVGLLIELCEELAWLTDKINTLDRDITTRVTKQYPRLIARPGVGPIVAATIVGELGDPARIRSGAALARLAGTAPIPVWTSNTTRHRLDRGGNRKLNHAIHIVALVQARSHPPAKELITRNQDKKGRRGAMRIIKRHLTDAIYRDLQTDLAHHTSTNAAA